MVLMAKRFRFSVFAIVVFTEMKMCISSGIKPCVCVKKYLGTLTQPVFMEQETGNKKRIFIGEQAGFIHAYSPLFKDPKLLVDMSSFVTYHRLTMDERGLLGFALHPNFDSNGKFYTYSIRRFQNEEFAFITELKEERDGDGVDVSREKLLMIIKQHTGKRNGGQLLFGKDGYLYIAVGDGGELKDNTSHAQDLNSLLGKILRIDVDGTMVVNNIIKSYSIPSGNPFNNRQDAKHEIFAYGFRNPWRCSFDTESVNGTLFCGDLGDNKAEEVDIVEKGLNYGWDIKEGDECLKPQKCNNISGEGQPIFVYGHGQQGGAVLGGHVYRGQAMKDLVGKYIFADILQRTLFTLTKNNFNWTRDKLSFCEPSKCPCDSRDLTSVNSSYIVSFGQDNNGELYLLASLAFHGKTEHDVVAKLVPPSATSVVCGSQAVFRHTQQMLSTVLLCLFIILNKFIFD